MHILCSNAFTLDIVVILCLVYSNFCTQKKNQGIRAQHTNIYIYIYIYIYISQPLNHEREKRLPHSWNKNSKSGTNYKFKVTTDGWANSLKKTKSTAFRYQLAVSIAKTRTERLILRGFVRGKYYIAVLLSHIKIEQIEQIWIVLMADYEQEVILPPHSS